MEEIKGGLNTDDRQLEHLLDSMREFEAKIMSQLDELSQKMPEIYKGYAKIVRDTFGTALGVMTLSAVKKNRYLLAGEVLARGIGAIGAYKAAKRHNKMLDRYQEVKKEHARLNMGKVVRLNDEVKRNLPMAEKFFRYGMNLRYDLRDADEKKVLRVANIELRYLTLYRTSLFLLEISKYLMKEYDAWNHGNQTSGYRMPDYYSVNELLLKDISPNGEGYKGIELAAESDGRLTGAEIMLLSDPQLSLCSLKDSFAEINYKDASPAVKIMLEENEGVQRYISESHAYMTHIRKKPALVINFLCFLALAGTFCLAFFYFPHGAFRWIIFGLSVGAIIKIDRTNVMKIKIAHVKEGEKIIEAARKKMTEYCGYVPTPDFDYKHKSKLKETAKTFFG